MIVDYSKGKIYKITNDFNEDIYIGSTCDTLEKRYSSHKSLAKTKSFPLYKLMNQIGFTRFVIQLVENYPCNNVYELRQREGYYIRQMGSLNIIISGREHKEYRETNKEKIKQKHNAYREANKEMLKEKRKEKYHTNKEAEQKAWRE